MPHHIINFSIYRILYSGCLFFSNLSNPELIYVCLFCIYRMYNYFDLQIISDLFIEHKLQDFVLPIFEQHYFIDNISMAVRILVETIRVLSEQDPYK